MQPWIHSTLAAAAVIVTTTGCIEGIENQSAYESQRYLCDSSTNEEWSDLIAQCERRQSRGVTCGGALSMQGNLQGDSVTIESLLHVSRFTVADVELSTVDFVDRVQLVGSGPYFLFTFKMSSLGGLADTVSTDRREMRWHTDAETISPSIDAMQDGLVRGDLRLENGQDNEEIRALGDFGSLTIRTQGPGQLTGDFKASFGAPEDQMRGCFHAVATEVRVESL